MIDPIPFNVYDRETSSLRSEVDKLREISAFKSVELHQRDRVIARLLDGWQPELRKVQRWVRSYSADVGPFAEMSDGEAAIIRQHQESKS